MEKIGDRLRAAREKRGMTMEALSKASRVSQSMLSRLEGGTRDSLTLERAAAICDALGITLDELAGRVQAKTSRRHATDLARAQKLAAELLAALDRLA